MHQGGDVRREEPVKRWRDAIRWKRPYPGIRSPAFPSTYACADPAVAALASCVTSHHHRPRPTCWQHISHRILRSTTAARSCLRSTPYGRRIQSSTVLIQATTTSSLVGRTSSNNQSCRITQTASKTRRRYFPLHTRNKRGEESAYSSKWTMETSLPCTPDNVMDFSASVDGDGQHSSLLQKTSLPAILDMKWSALLAPCLERVRDISQVPHRTFRQSYSRHRRLRGWCHASYSTI